MKTHGTRKNYVRKFALGFSFIAIVFSSCQKHEVPETLGLELVAENLISPIGVVAAPDNTKRLFVIEQAGKIWIVENNGKMLSTPFLDVTSRMITLNPNFDERGLLGLAFHP